MSFAEVTINPFANEHPEAFLATIVGFVLMAWFLYKVPVPYLSIPYLRTTLNERAGRIEESHRQVEQALAEVKKVRDDYAARIAQIETEASQRIEAAVREAEAARAEIIADAAEAAKATHRRMEEELSRERTRQRILLRRQLVQVTLDAAEHTLRENTDDGMQRHLIQQFIAVAAAGVPSAAPESTTTVNAPAGASANDGAAGSQDASQREKGV